MNLPSAVIADLSRASRLLVLGPGARALAGTLRGRGGRVVELGDSPQGLAELAAASPAAFDAVVSWEFVERIPWDRWALQQIHRLLEVDGRLVLVVPDLYSPLSLADPRYLAARIAKVTGHATASARDSARHYDRQRLEAMLESVGFEVERVLGAGRRNAPGILQWVRDHHVVMARKQAFDPPAWVTRVSDASAFQRSYESRHAAWLRRRDAWRRIAGDVEARPLDLHAVARDPILVLAPHPDDELIGCGGTLLQLVRHGARVTVLQATDGSASAALQGEPESVRRSVRLAEADAVARAAGFQPSILWREPNEAFAMRPQLVDRLRETLEQLRPSWIFTPFLADVHPDHLTLSRILAAALTGGSGSPPTVLGYEVWGLAPATNFCDVSSCMELLEQLLWRYETAMKVDDFVHMIRLRNHYHALTLARSGGYVEAFAARDRESFLALVARTPGAAS